MRVIHKINQKVSTGGGGYLKSCLATTLILTLSLLLIPNLYTDNSASAESIEGSIYNLSTSIDSNIDITVPQTGTITTGSHDVIVSTTCPAGYTLSIETDNDGKIYRNADTTSEYYLSSVSGTLENPTELENNQWGFSITNPSTNNNKFSAVPTTKTDIKTTNPGTATPPEGDKTPIYYGIKADNTLPSGNYNGTIIYTTTPNPACFAYTIHFNSGSGTPAYPSKNLTYSESIDLSTYSPTLNGYVFAGWSDGTKTYKGTVSATDLNPSNQSEITLTAQWELIQTWNFDYTGGEQTFTAPVDGTYRIELWGAQGNGNNTGAEAAAAGGNYVQVDSGYAAYVSGTLSIQKNTVFYLYVGGMGNLIAQGLNDNGPYGFVWANGGWNGGGGNYGLRNGTGGGATDIAVVASAVTLNAQHVFVRSDASYRSRIMVAAGSSGVSAHGGRTSDKHSFRAPSAGGLIGEIKNLYDTTTLCPWVGCIGGAGNQTAGGVSLNPSRGHTEGKTFDGGFGYGGSGYGRDYQASYGCASSGGGGWYGGAGSYGAELTGGGSSYISGHTGSVAVTSTTSSSPRSGCTTGTTNNACSISPYINPVTNTGYAFADTIMIDGTGYKWTNTKDSLQQMPNPAGGYYALGTGHTGNGYARITLIGTSL